MNPKKAPFTLSVLLHLLVFALIIVHFVQKPTGNAHHATIIETYLYHGNLEKQKSISRQKKQAQNKHIEHKNIMKQSIINHAHINQTTIHTKTITHTPKALSTGVRSKLLEALHDAIAKNLIYPEQAAFLEMQGTAQIGFSLHPSGIINQIKITHSSGHKLLDKAAISTLSALSPFPLAKQFLHKAEYFNVGVVFQQ